MTECQKPPYSLMMQVPKKKRRVEETQISTQMGDLWVSKQHSLSASTSARILLEMVELPNLSSPTPHLFPPHHQMEIFLTHQVPTLQKVYWNPSMQEEVSLPTTTRSC